MARVEVEVLTSYLERHAPRAVLLAPGPAMPTVDAAAKALDVSPNKVVKSILFQEKRGESRCVLVLATGNGRVSAVKLAKLANLRSLRLASADTVREVTGFGVGGVPPVGHAHRVAVVVDPQVLAEDFVYGGGGDEFHMLKICPADIVALTGAMVAAVVDDNVTV